MNFLTIDSSSMSCITLVYFIIYLVINKFSTTKNWENVTFENSKKRCGSAEIFLSGCWVNILVVA